MNPLITKPFYSSITIIILLPLLVFLLSSAVLYIFGMKSLDEHRIDKLFHVVGGMSISISTSGVLWHLVHRKIIVLQDKNVFRFLVFGSVCFAVISWEIFEYFLPFDPEFLSFTYSDTIFDMICGLIGGLLGLFFVRVK